MSGVKRGPCLSELFRVGLETFRTLRTSGLFCVGRMSPYAPDVGAFLCRCVKHVRALRFGRAGARTSGRVAFAGFTLSCPFSVSVLRLRSPSPVPVSGSRLRSPSPVPVSGSRLRSPFPFSVSVSVSRLRFLPACPAGRNHPSGRFSKRKLPAVVGWVKCRNRAIIG